MGNNKQSVSIWRVISAFFCYLLVFTFLFALFLSLIRGLFQALDSTAFFSTIFSLPIIGTITYVVPVLGLIGVALSLSNTLCIWLTGVINKNNELSCAKTFIGVGIALLIIHIIDLIFNLYIGANVSKNIFPLINGIYLLIFGLRSKRDTLQDFSTQPEPQKQSSVQQNTFAPYVISAYQLVDKYAKRMNMTIPDYCRWSYEQEFLKKEFDADTAKQMALVAQPTTDPADESASIQAACSLVEQYAKRMQMSVPQYLNWVKEQEQLRAQN